MPRVYQFYRRFITGGAGATPNLAWGPNFGGADGDQLSVGIDFPAGQQTARFQGTILAAKDTYTDDIALCPAPVNVNHNGEDLITDGVVATKRIIFVGFDVSTLPAGAVVTSATLTINRVNTSLTDNTVDLRRLADGDEGWNEAVIRCDNDPAVGAILQSAAIGLTAGEKVITLNAAWIARIQARLGVGNVSIIVDSPALQVANTFEATDQGVNDALGPRLTLDITRTLPSV